MLYYAISLPLGHDLLEINSGKITPRVTPLPQKALIVSIGLGKWEQSFGD